MKKYRPFSFVLLAFIVGTAAFAQDGAELASLRAKAERGNGIAQYNLGLAYLEGRGTPANPMEAYVWLSLARENGTRGRALDGLIATFDRATLEAAQKKLADFKAASGINTPAPAPIRTEPAVPASVEPDAPRPPPGGLSELPPPAPSRAMPGDDAALDRLRAERDALSNRLNELAAEVAGLRAERQRLAQQAVAGEKTIEAATAATRNLQEQIRTAEGRAAELARDAETAKAELARTQQALAALQSAPKPAPDNSALEAKSRELQAALAELEASRRFGRQVEDTLNKVNDEKARVAAAAAAELEASRKFGQQVEATLNRVTDENAALQTQLAQAKQALVAKPAAPAYPDLRNQVAELESQLAAAKSAKPAYPDLRSNVATLEAQLAAAKSAKPAYPDLSGKVSELEDQVATLAVAAADAKKALAAKPVYPDLSGKVAELEAALAAKPVYPDLRKNVATLETQLAAAKSAKPAYPDLSGKVSELESQVATLTADAAQSKNQLAALTQARDAATKLATETQRALAAAKSAKPAYPDLSGKVSELEDQVATLSRTAAEAQKALAAKPAYPDLRSNVVALETQLAAAKSAKPAYPDLSGKVAELEAALAAKPAAPAYPDLSGRVQQLEGQLASATETIGRFRAEMATLTKAKTEAEQALAAAKSAKPAYPDLSGKVAELETALTAARQAKPAYPDLSGRVAELESAVTQTLGRLRDREVELQQLAAKSAKPAYPDLSDQVKQLEQALADTNRQLIAAQNAKPPAPAYPDLSGKVAELEAEAAKAREDTEQKLAAAEQARADLARQFDAYKSATIAAQRESTTLQANLKMLESDKASLRRQIDAATAEAGQLRTQVAALKTAAAAIKPAAPAYPDLSDKVAELETRVASLNQENQAAQAQIGGLTSERNAARTAQNELRDTIAKLAEEKTSLVAAVDTARQAAPAYPDLSGRVKELEAQLAARSAAPAYPDLRNNVAALETQLAAAKSAKPAYPDLSGKVAELEAALAAKPAAPAYPDLSEKVASLESTVSNLTGEIAQARQSRADLSRQFDAYKSATVASQREATTLQASVKMLESDKASLRRQVEAATTEAGQLRTQVATLKAAAAGIKPAAPAYPDLSGRVSELEARLASAEKAAAEKPAAPAYPDLSGKVAELETELAESKSKLTAATSAMVELQQDVSAARRPVAPPGYLEHMRELETNQLALQQQLAEATAAAQNAAKAGEDNAQLRRERDELSGRVTNLAGEVAQLRGDRERMQKLLADAGQQMRASSAADARIKELEAKVLSDGQQAEAANLQIAQLRMALAEKPAAPAYPDLSGRVSELEAKLAAAAQASTVPAPGSSELEKKLTEAEEKLATSLRGYAALERERDALAARADQVPAAPAYPDLSGRVSELETSLASTQRRLSDTEAALAAEQAKPAAVAAAPADTGTTSSELEQKLTETEDKLTAALRSYAVLQRERDTLAERAAQSTAEVTAQNNALAARLTGVETRVAAAEAEAARANEALGALQRSSAQATNDLAATRALARQLQGANTVLANENYQLKTMLARSVGSSAPTAPAPVTTPTAPTTPVSGIRTHLIAAGDSLSRISQRYYGNANRWPDIYNANRDRIGPDGILHVGVELRIP